MAIHSSTLVWEIPDKVAWQAKESMESQKRQTQLSNLTIVYIYIYMYSVSLENSNTDNSLMILCVLQI